MQQKVSHNHWYEPEPPNYVLLIGLAVKFNIGHVVKRYQVENNGCDARDSKPTPKPGATTERERARHRKTY
jgi:hypothetical protein